MAIKIKNTELDAHADLSASLVRRDPASEMLLGLCVLTLFGYYLASALAHEHRQIRSSGRIMLEEPTSNSLYLCAKRSALSVKQAPYPNETN